jgi:predicted nuclease of restriction endonuclease-like (RecB) superfamily
MKQPSTIKTLVSVISETDRFFKSQAQRQVNVALTIRNWLIGFYIVEYEQNGDDRAVYGGKLIDNLSVQLRAKKLKGFSQISLRMYRAFYLAYPQIQQSATVELYLTNTGLSAGKTLQAGNGQLKMDIEKLINQLSFTHIIELLKTDSPLKRNFYEVEAIKNAWSVRELQRAMNSMLFERTGLSEDKHTLLKKNNNQKKLLPEDVFRNSYILEFLGLKEETAYSESDMEQAIIDHLQIFLLELGRGFCFECRQKRITFDNTHYHIDLVFYHRILKCHVLIDLKLGEFSHADSGQMNVYLNYYRENESQKDDNPPVGIILCATKNESLVKYATANLPHKLFIYKYRINLPSEIELEKIIKEEQEKLQLQR